MGISSDQMVFTSNTSRPLKLVIDLDEGREVHFLVQSTATAPTLTLLDHTVPRADWLEALGEVIEIMGEHA